GAGTAAEKVAAFRRAGVRVVESPAEMGKAVAAALARRATRARPGRRPRPAARPRGARRSSAGAGRRR
ncbi:MAG TPA: succinate--CoA ligase subunit alpha, partial [Candidatus Methylomirabilis sp.]|nr:succinate--CoA ligase subunit alpha [Candidatus Methylomirabilis sp.]